MLFMTLECIFDKFNSFLLNISVSIDILLKNSIITLLRSVIGCS